MAQTGDLSSLAAVKAWLNSGNQQAYPAGSDELLGSLITSCSKYVRSYLNSPLVPADYSERYNGSGTAALFLRNRPVVSVSSLQIGSTAVLPTSNPETPGFIFDDTRVFMPCSFFPIGTMNVLVGYTAGYQASAAVTIGATSAMKTVDLSGTSQVDGFVAGPWNSDRGVTLSDGTKLQAVSGAPAAGQYQVTTDAEKNFVYNFNSAQQDAAATLLYGYTPQDLFEVVTELVGERYKVRSRIGQVSQNMGNGQTVSWSQKDFGDWAKTILANYENVVPV